MRAPAALTLTLTLVACGSSPSSTSVGAAGGAGQGGGAGAGAMSQGGAGAGAQGGAGAGLSTGCTAACDDGQFCSQAGICIPLGTCADPADCDEGLTCDEAGECVPGGGCGGLEATIEAVPPNLLVVLDRSCSMTSTVSGGMNKWQIAVAALNGMTTTYEGQIRFGLTLFPDTVTPACEQDAIPFPVGPGNEAGMQALLTAALAGNDPLYPDGPCVTNIDTGMLQASTDVGLADPDRASYVLLLTDGKQSSGCSAAGGDAGTTTIIGDLYAAGVPTFVLGFGVGVDPTQLDVFAAAGGVPNPAGPNAFYDASDQASLDAALDAIASATLSCTFALDSVPPDPAEIFVFFDDVQKIPNDPTGVEGFSYDPVTNSVTFHGAACEALKSGAVGDVDVVFGCDEPTPA